MNEAGEVSIDGPRAGTIADQVLNLAGGCICCDTKDDLAWSITQLVQDYQSTLIVRMLRHGRSGGSRRCGDRCLRLTDCETRTDSRPAASRSAARPGMAELVTRNAIRYADDLILNKRDLYIPGHWEQFRETITRYNPYARIWKPTMPDWTFPALLAAPATRTVPTNVIFGSEPFTSGYTPIPCVPPPDGDHCAATETTGPYTVHGWTSRCRRAWNARRDFFALHRNPNCKSFSSFRPAPARGPGHAARLNRTMSCVDRTRLRPGTLSSVPPRLFIRLAQGDRTDLEPEGKRG